MIAVAIWATQAGGPRLSSLRLTARTPVLNGAAAGEEG